MRLLVIEDDPRMLELLRAGLNERGFTVMTAADGAIGLAIAIACEFDAIVLDIGLPKMDGYQLMRELRGRVQSAPVLMLTARDSEEEIIRGLDLGADDYLTKPFSFSELAARLQSITRPHRGGGESIEAGEISVDLIRHKVRRNNQNIDLTRLEYRLLKRLADQAGQCVSRQQLTESIWGPGHEIEAGTLHVLVNSLRAKVDAPFGIRLIDTIRGKGYMLRRGIRPKEVL